MPSRKPWSTNMRRSRDTMCAPSSSNWIAPARPLSNASDYRHSRQMPVLAINFIRSYYRFRPQSGGPPVIVMQAA